MLDNLFEIFNGKKTYLAALGLLGLALYHALVREDYQSAARSLLEALGAVGLRHAIAKNGADL